MVINVIFCLQKVIKGEELSKFEQTQIDQAKRIMKPFLLRRLKNDVLRSLPTKTEKVVSYVLQYTQYSFNFFFNYTVKQIDFLILTIDYRSAVGETKRYVWQFGATLLK